MTRRPLFTCLFVFWTILVCGCYAQDTQSKNSDLLSAIDRFQADRSGITTNLQTPQAADNSDIQKCQAKVQEWRDWAEQAKEKHQSLLNDFKELQSDYDELEKQKTFTLDIAGMVLLCAIGVGLGIGLFNKITTVRLRDWVQTVSSRHAIS